MSPHQGAVDRQVFQVHVGAKRGEEPFENSEGLPSGEPFVNAVPFAIFSLLPLFPRKPFFIKVPSTWSG